MLGADERWRGFSVKLFGPEAHDPNVYRVEFWANKPMQARGLKRGVWKVPKVCGVKVEAEEELQVIFYQPPDKTYFDITRSEITQEHYEEKALEEVRKKLAETPSPNSPRRHD